MTARLQPYYKRLDYRDLETKKGVFIMSIKSRLKSIERKLPDSKAVAAKFKPGKQELLLVDYEEYREAITAWIMALYMGDPEKIEETEKKAESLLETLEPISKPSQFDLKKSQQLLAVKIVDWMEENGVDDLDDERWEALTNKHQIQF